MARRSFHLRRSIYLAPTLAAMAALLLLAIFLQNQDRERRAWNRAWDERTAATREVNALFGRFTLAHSNLFSQMAREGAGIGGEAVAAPEREQLARIRDIQTALLSLGDTHFQSTSSEENQRLNALFTRAIVDLGDYEAMVRGLLDRPKGRTRFPVEGLNAAIRAFQKTHQDFVSLREGLEATMVQAARTTLAEREWRATVAWTVALALIPLVFVVAHWVSRDVTGTLGRLIQRLRFLSEEARHDLRAEGEDPNLPTGSDRPQEDSPTGGDSLARLWDGVEAFERVLQELRRSRTSLAEHVEELARQTEGRAAAEAAFGASEARFRALVDNANVAICVHRRFTMLYMNPAMATLLRLEGENQSVTDLSQFIAPEEKTQIRAIHEARLEDGHPPSEYEITMVRPDGERRTVLSRSLRMDWEGGPAVCTILLDLTERNKATERLRVVSTALDQTPNMFFVTDSKGTIQYVNPAFTQLTGYTAEEALGRKPSLLRHPSTPPETHADLWTTILSGREWRSELLDRRKDGSAFWAFTSISPVRDDGGEITHFVAMHQDITDRKTAERNLTRAKEEAEVANRAKTELLANMSHELRTPLNAIIGFSETMLGQFLGPLNENYRGYAKDIRDSGSHLLSLINDILDVSAIETGRLTLGEEEHAIGDLLRGVDRLVRPRADLAGVTLRVAVEGTPPALYCDGRRVKQILLNLLSNAIKFTGPGGKVEVRASMDARNRMMVEITDTGIGMDAEGLAKAMTPFGQVESGLARKHQGSGLGLPLTRGLVEQHGGRFTLDSAPGVGTTARVLFPAERSRPRDLAEPVSTSS